MVVDEGLRGFSMRFLIISGPEEEVQTPGNF